MKTFPIVLFATALTTSAFAQTPPPINDTQEHAPVGTPSATDVPNRSSAAPADRMPNRSTPDTVGSTVSSNDAAFVKTLAAGGMAEVETGKVAAKRASNNDVKKFAEKMVTDHSKTNDKLKSLAKARKVELPTSTTPEQQEKKAMLEAQRGIAFDRQYIQSQVQAHEKTVQLLQQQIASGQDANTRQFAQEILPTVKHHLEMARQLNAQLQPSSAGSARAENESH